MKTKILFLLILITSFAYGQIPPYVPTNGLVGWWPFDSNANDESGNGNNGIVNGATLTNDRFGNPNSAYRFDGITQHIVINNNSSLNVPYGNSWSISGWIKHSSTNQNIGKYIVSKYGGLSNIGPSYAIGTGFQGNSYSWHQVTAGNSNGREVRGSHTINDGSWHQFVSVLEMGVSASIYIDGVLDSTVNFPFTDSISNGYNLFIGCGANLQQFYSGDVDDIGIWDRALTQQEISDLSNGTPSNPCLVGLLPISLNQGLVSWYPFCGNAKDESGNGNNGTLNGATLTTDRWGNSSSAYEFNGVDNYISAPLNLSSYGISLWFEADTLSSQFSNLYDYENTYAELTNDSTVYSRVQRPSPPSIGVLTTYKNNLLQWHHLVVNFDSLANQMEVYIDNVNHFTSSNATGGVYHNTDNNDTIYFGGYFLHGINYFNGKIDDIRIYNRSIDSIEVSSLYNEGLCFQTVTGSCDTLIFNANITGFNPVTFANHILVYPNPAHDHIILDCGTNYSGLNGYSIRISDMLGQVVYNSIITSQVTSIQFNPPQWNHGTYVVQLVNPQGGVMETKTMILQ